MGLDDADVVLLALSRASMRGNFPAIEWLSSIWRELRYHDATVVPLLLEDIEVPTLLRGRRHADFRSHYIVGWTQLVTSLAQRSDASGFGRYVSDVVEMGDDWTRLLQRTTRLDVVVMYGATWRNTYRKHLERLATEPSGLRVVLPDPSPDSPVLSAYAARLGIHFRSVAALVNAAISDFLDMGPGAEVYLARVVFPHALYLFDTKAVIALYAMCCERVPTPALIFEQGHFHEFARDDLERLIAGHTRRANDTASEGS